MCEQVSRIWGVHTLQFNIMEIMYVYLHWLRSTTVMSTFRSQLSQPQGFTLLGLVERRAFGVFITSSFYITTVFLVQLFVLILILRT